MTIDLQESPQTLEALHTFRMIFRAVRRHFQRIEEHVGISGAHTWALSLVMDRPGMTVSQLAEAMSIHQSTASNLIDKLVRLGLIERIKEGADLRVTYLQATPTGKQCLNGITGPVTGVLPAALNRLTPEKLNQLNKALAGLMAEMSGLESDDGLVPLADTLKRD